MKPNLHLVGTRNFLDTLTSMGISAPAVDHLTVEELRALTDDPTDEVPRLSRLESTADSASEGRSERTPVFYTIPHDVWERREGARKAANELGAQLRTAGYDGVRTEITSRVNGGHRELVVNVVRTKRVRSVPDGRGSATRRIVEPEISLGELSGEVPETVECTVGEGAYQRTVEDIPVAVEERTEELTAASCFDEHFGDGYFDDYYDPIPGGVQFMWAGLLPCTICCPVYDDDAGEERLLTAAHCVFDNGEYEVEDLTHTERIYQPYPHHFFNDDWNTDVGRPDLEKMIGVYSAYHEEKDDAAIVDLSETDREIEWRMGTDDGGYSDEPIKGTIAFDELLDNAPDRSYTVHHQGRTTGQNEGWLRGVSDDDNDLGYIRLGGVRTDGGDSGGPFYRIEEDCDGDDAIFLVGVQHSQVGRADYPVGNAVSLVERALNVEVNPGANC